MSILTLREGRKDFGIKEILRSGSLTVEPGDRVGLIGTNGSGKSTLLKMLAGLEPFDGGDFWVNSGYRVAYLPQDPQLGRDRTVLEQVFADCGDRMALVREYEDISHRLPHTTGPDLERLMGRLTAVGDRLAAADAWDLETQAKIVLSKLGIDDFDTPVAQLSGGYRRRVALATALLSEPDLLLMDEPTNHLDADSVQWLQDYLSDFRGALLLVTHDRYFLDRVTTRILELDRGDLYSYDGNYSYYLEKKAAAELVESGRQRKVQNLLRRELAWLQRGAKARSTKQKARIDRAVALQETEFKEDLGAVEVSTASRRIGKKVIELENLCKTWGDHPIIRDFSYTFSPRDRIGIIGGNGAGKSTLTNLIAGRLEPDQGRVDIGETIHIGYFDQHSNDLAGKENWRVINYLKETAELVKTADGTVITAAQMLERFLFPPDLQYAPIEKLSGGERRRLFLLKVLLESPNVLILDEPTNDLDVQTLAVLEDYLENFNGCVIVVSHDRYFLDRVVNQLFCVEPGGHLRPYPGNYSFYLNTKAREAAEAREQQDILAKAAAKETAAIAKSSAPKGTSNPATANPETARTSGRNRKLSFKEKRELETLETKIPDLETEKAAIETQLYENPPSEFGELEALSSRLAALALEIDQATERWLELSEIAEGS